MKHHTNIQRLRVDSGWFTWGAIVEIIEIGKFTLVRYNPWQRDGSQVLTGEPDFKNAEFYGWIDDKPTHRSWGTIEEAMIGIVAFSKGHETVTPYICKMLGMP